jgi:ferredoxin-type protein NapG
MSRRELLRGRFLRSLADVLSDALPLGHETGPDASVTPTGRFRGRFPVHRPPGAVDEATFLRDCTRCDACLEACPHDAITHAPSRLREAAGTPMIDPARQPCKMCEDTPCIPVCEPGVLSATLPLTMARAMIVDETCLAHQGMTCTVCLEQCPVSGAIVFEEGRPRIVEETCTGCGVCHYVCPAPTNAVIVMPLQDRPPRPVQAVEGNATRADAGDEPDGIVFPPMQESTLDTEQLNRLFDDLRDHARVLEIRIKGGPRSNVDASAVTLEQARDVIASRSARGVQVRYLYESTAWLDTLMIGPEGVRLVRVETESASEA